jgi:hypothetical protein
MPIATPHTPLVLSRRAALLGLSALAVGLAAAPTRNAAAQESAGTRIPAVLAAYGTDWTMKGTGVLKFFGFKAYDATLWLTGSSAGQFSFNRAFALEIVYNTYIKASDICNTSLIEMARLSSATQEQVKSWSAFMTGMFVDVKGDDRLIGVHVPGAGARFFLNGKPLGETTDPQFSEAFFKIWLDAKARKPELRAALLGQTQ